MQHRSPTLRKKTIAHTHLWLTGALCLNLGLFSHAQPAETPLAQPPQVATAQTEQPQANAAHASVKSLILVRVDPNIFPAEPNAIVALMMSDSILGQAADEKLSGNRHHVQLTPSGSGGSGLSLIQIQVLPHYPTDKAKAKAFIQTFTNRLKEILELLTHIREDDISNERLRAAENIHDLNRNQKQLQLQLAQIEQAAQTASQIRAHTDTIQKANIEVAQLEAERLAVVEAMAKAQQQAQRQAQQEPVSQKLKAVQESLKQQIQTVKHRYEAGKISAEAIQKLEQELLLSETELVKRNEQLIQRAFDVEHYKRQLVQLSIQQAKLASRIKQQQALTDASPNDPRADQATSLEIKQHLSQIKREFQIATETLADAHRRQRQIIKPQVRVID